MIDGETGFIVKNSVDDIKNAILRILSLSPEERVTMGIKARKAVEKFGINSFISKCYELFSSFG